jgi:predicted CxxxxCH...CXXCH cytochrome family protein
MEENQLVFRDPSRHIDGKIDVVAEGATGGCSTCHGSSTNAAPPRDLLGNTASPKVGAHQAHLRTSNWRHQIACSACHIVPLTSEAPGHRDGDGISEQVFDTLNPAASYSGGTCSSLYCHGNGRGNNGTATWTSTQPYTCGRCHSITGNNMSGKHSYHIGEKNLKCNVCHSTVVNASMTIINANLHVNGVHEVKMAQGTFNSVTRQCSNVGCHGTKSWTSGD